MRPLPAGAASAVEDEEKPKPAAAPAGAADSFCPDCRRPVSWEDARCAGCGAEFEPLRPRVKKGAAGESPFPAPAQGEPPDKEAPGEQIIPSPWRQIQPPERARFGFGSYGRVGFDIDLDQDGAKVVDIVDFRPRLGKGPYEELHFFYKDRIEELPVLVKSTLAFDQKLFHYDGEFDARMALRELYAEVEPASGLALWVGARMYRGDDIYLFDFWPLDDQNTLGGGGALKLGDAHRLQAHVGVNRITEDDTFFYFQDVELPTEVPGETRRAVFLDRNRGVGSLTYAYAPDTGLRAKVHAEAHYLPPGRRRLTGGVQQKLPSDDGVLLGAQVGYRAEGGSFGNLFARYAVDLAAHDELSVPFGLDVDLMLSGTERIIVGVGGALEASFGGAHFGGYWQLFEDADGLPDRDDSQQLAVAVRPLLYLGDYFRAGFEASWQSLEHEGVFPETGAEERQTVTKLTLLAGVAPKRALFARPELLAFFSMRWLNREARLDLGRTRFAEPPDAQEHSWGLLAEWWF